MNVVTFPYAELGLQYDRIDPAEVQALKSEIEQLKAEKEKSVVEQTGLIASQVERVRDSHHETLFLIMSLHS